MNYLNVILVFVACTYAFTFELPARSIRCFSEEFAQNVIVRSKYEALKGYAQFVDVKISDPLEEVVWEETGKDSGEYAFRVLYPGEYALCFYSRLVPGTKVTEGMKRIISAEFRTGVDAEDFSNIIEKNKLKPSEVDLAVIEESVSRLHNDFAYLKDREIESSATSDYIFKRTVWLSLVVMITIFGFSIWQARHIRNYFKRKRMID